MDILLFAVLHVTIVYMYVRTTYMQDLCKSRLGMAQQTLTHVAHVTTSAESLEWLTAAKLKPLKLNFLYRPSPFPKSQTFCLFILLYDLRLLPAQFRYAIINIRVLGKPCATRGPVCTLEIYQWSGEPYFASSAGAKGGYLQQIPRRGKHKSLLS
jgi:hypothetical protein